MGLGICPCLLGPEPPQAWWLLFWSTAQCDEKSIPPNVALMWPHPSHLCNDSIPSGKTMARWTRAPTLEPDSLGSNPSSIT